MTLEMTQIEMVDCRLLDLNINAPAEIEEEAGEAEIQLRSDFGIIGKDGDTVTIRYALSMEPSQGTYYTAGVTALAVFSFHGDATEKEVEDYLRTFALMRVYDWARAVIESASATGILGPIRLPVDPPHLVER